jgi:hypothetical protein
VFAWLDILPERTREGKMSLFDRLKAEGESALEDLCMRNVEEGLHLEFKSKHDPARSELTDTDRRNWGKCLSAFSNAEGGVVVWGIKTGKGAESDFAENLVAINAPETFAARLRQLAGEYISPPNDYVEIVPIISLKFIGHGYVVVRIPASTRRPHMSRAREEQRYYRRSVGRSNLMEHYEVIDMIRAGTSPTLELRADIASLGTDRKGAVRLWIHNLGPIAARDAYVVIDELSPSGWTAHAQLPWQERLRWDCKRSFYAPSSSIIHAEDAIEVLRLKFEISPDFRRIGWKQHQFVPASTFAFNFTCRCGAENAAISLHKLVVSGEDLVKHW